MKQKDIALILVIVIISAILSLVISKKMFASPQNSQQSVVVVQPITADFPQPSNKYFNANSIDPTQLITISQNNNTNPFNSSSGSQ
jgi:hypothetical protein